MNYDYEGMGYRIAAERKKQNLTQAQFAEQLGVSAQAVSKWETGAGYPDLSLIPRIATVLDITIDKLFGVERIPEKDLKQQRDPELPETVSGLHWVATYGDRILYASKPEAEIDLPNVTFQDGSTADLSSNYIVNKGQNILIFDKNELTELTAGTPAIQDELKELKEQAQASLDQKTKREDDVRPAQPSGDKFKRLALDLSNESLDVEILHDPNLGFGWFFAGDPETVGVLEAKTQAFLEEDLLAIRVRGQKQSGIFTRFFNTIKSQGVRLVINCPEPYLDELLCEGKGAETVHCHVAVKGGELSTTGAGDYTFTSLSNVLVTTKGAADIIIDDGQDLRIESYGASDIIVKNYSGGDLFVRLAGAGDVEVGGVCENFTTQLTGVGDIDASELTAETLNAMITGPASLLIGRVIGESIEHVQPMGTLKILQRGRD